MVLYPLDHYYNILIRIIKQMFLFFVISCYSPALGFTVTESGSLEVSKFNTPWQRARFSQLQLYHTDFNHLFFLVSVLAIPDTFLPPFFEGVPYDPKSLPATSVLPLYTVALAHCPAYIS